MKPGKQRRGHPLPLQRFIRRFEDVKMLVKAVIVRFLPERMGRAVVSFPPDQKEHFVPAVGIKVADGYIRHIPPGGGLPENPVILPPGQGALMQGKLTAVQVLRFFLPGDPAGKKNTAVIERNQKDNECEYRCQGKERFFQSV